MKFSLKDAGRAVNNDDFKTVDVTLKSVVPQPDWNSYIKVNGEGTPERVHVGRSKPDSLDYDFMYEACLVHAIEDGDTEITSVFTDYSKLSHRLESYNGAKAVMTFQRRDMGEAAVEAKQQQLMDESYADLVKEYTGKGATKAEAEKSAKADIKAKAAKVRYAWNLRRCQIDTSTSKEAEIYVRAKALRDMGVAVHM